MVRDGIRIREGGVPVSALVCPDDSAPAWPRTPLTGNERIPLPRTWGEWQAAHPDQNKQADERGRAIYVQWAALEQGEADQSRS